MRLNIIVSAVVAMFFLAACGGQRALHAAEEVLEDGRPRFVDHGEIVEDRKTSLLWQKDGFAAGARNHPDAVEYAKGLKLGGIGGWRLPKAIELSAIFPANNAPWINSHYNPKEFPSNKGIFVLYWAADPPRNEIRDELARACAYSWWGDGGFQDAIATKNLFRVRFVRGPLKDGEVITKVVNKTAQQPKTPVLRPSSPDEVKNIIGGVLGDTTPQVPKTAPQPKPTVDVIPEREKFDPKLPIDLRDGLTAYWNFDFDERGVLRNLAGKTQLTLRGGDLTFGFRGNAWWHLTANRREKGEPEYCELGTSDELNFADNADFTIAGWVYPRGGGPALALQNSRTDAQLMLKVLQNGLILVSLVDDNHLAGQGVNLAARRVIDEQWHHIAICRRPGLLELFCDGERMAETKSSLASGPISTDLRSFGIDRKAFRPELTADQQYALSWQGALDDFCVYSRAINVNEIRKLAAGDLYASVRDNPPPAPNLPPKLVLNTQVPTSPRHPPSVTAGEKNTDLKIAARPKEASEKQLDLTSFYNASLVGTWHPTTQVSGERANDLAGLPTGIQTFEGTVFDVRGVIQLQHAHTLYWRGRFSTRVEGIPVKQKIAKIHCLHATAFGTRDGNEIGGYELHYDDKSKEWLPIKFGEDVRDWWSYRPETLGPRSKVVWLGTNESSAANNAGVRLFRTTWENPHPDRIVETLNFISLARDSAPFLIAITVE